MYIFPDLHSGTNREKMQETQWNFLVMMEVSKHITVVAVVVVGVMEILMFQMSMNNNK